MAKRVETEETETQTSDGNGEMSEEKKAALAKRLADRDRQRENEKISGYPIMYGVKREFLPEVTRLDRMEIYGMAAGAARESLLNTDPEALPVYETFVERLMRGYIGLDGLGRDEHIRIKAVERQAENENTIRGMGNDGFPAR